ncbi:GNAT family N-acetyltransferase [Alicyclobacillus dauci]|uniref:GNAT family N-acetyltransferase n=1 Tax=Alicyclobacillus dauci TaxID=1475485 RepID=A0ABY6Z510_9BACL|nr:GNAT family N-acetyltransferase [Alicyclobacillus dauci]WAH37286.1 GNAT family N-acetyltransferase [Alicyclobacillus dauci]
MVVIRKANLKDAGNMAKVHVDSWKTTYKGIVPDTYLERLSYERREAMWKHILSNQTNDVVFVAEDDEKGIVGFSSGGQERSQNPVYQGELYAIYLLQAFQGKGIGRQLTNAVVEYLINRGYSNMLLWVLQDNPSRHYYEHIGGKQFSEKVEEMDGKALIECSYVWDDIHTWKLN